MRISDWSSDVCSSDLDQRVLRDLQRPFSDTGLFFTVNAETGGENAEDGSVPVAVTVGEREHRSIGAAAAFSTDIGPSLELVRAHRKLSGGEAQLPVAPHVPSIEDRHTDVEGKRG